jgi:hypothetical protein
VKKFHVYQLVTESAYLLLANENEAFRDNALNSLRSELDRLGADVEAVDVGYVHADSAQSAMQKIREGKVIAYPGQVAPRRDG